MFSYPVGLLESMYFAFTYIYDNTLQIQAGNECSGKTGHMRSLARAFPAYPTVKSVESALFVSLSRPLDKSAYLLSKFKLSYFSTKTYVVGTQKNGLIETVLLSTQNLCEN